MRVPRSSRALLHMASVLVPAHRRREWLEEWAAEVEALAQAKATEVEGLPACLAFTAGAIPHAFWMRTEGWTMESVAQDLRFAIRTLGRSPGFTVVAALTLALGIGANASIFALVNGLVLRAPAEVEAPARLAQIARSYESAPRWDNFSWPAYRLIATESESFSGVAGYSTAAFVLGEGAESERLLGELVTGSYFEVLGARAAVGRLLQTEDDRRPGAHPVVVLSHELWTRRYGADEDVVGGSILIGSSPHVVVGVTRPGFAGVESVGTPPALFLPTMQHAGYSGTLPFEQWGTSWISLFGRLSEDVDFATAEAEMNVISNRLREANPENGDMSVLLAEGIGLDPEDRADALRISGILLGIVGLVLLITCTNVANLMLARSTGRRTEVSIRMALGAGRGRLARQFATECAVLAAGATLLATPMVLLADRTLPLLFPLTLSVSLAADGRVFAFLIVTGAAAGFLFGLAPAWIGSRSGVIDSLRESTSTGSRAGTGLRDALVVSQLGLSLGLVAGAALLGQSVINAHNADPGFESEGVTAAFLDLGTTGRYDRTSGAEFMRTLVEQAGQLPGVRSATLSNQIPLTGGHARASASPADNEEVRFEAEYIVVGPRYFETLGIPVVQGRGLGGFGEEPERVVVVNEALAEMFWPGQDPLGQDIDRGQLWRVVGVVGNVQMRSLRSRANPAIYYPVDQAYSASMSLQLVGDGPVAPDAGALRRTVAGLDPGLPVTSVIDLRNAIDNSMAETRTIGYLVAAFAGLALLLSIVGLYGLVAYGASQRIREIGIRIALGARPESLVRLIIGRGVVLAALGVAAGVVVAIGLGTALRGLLFGVGHTDAKTLTAAAALMLGTASLAAWLPARRASTLDPSTSLRDR